MTDPEYPRLSYGHLLSYVFPAAATDESSGTSTAQYSGTILPPEGAHLGRSDPDRSAIQFRERALAGLRNFFAAHSLLDEPLPQGISDQIHELATEQFPSTVIRSENDVKQITVFLFAVVQSIMRDLNKHTRMRLRLRYAASSTAWSQRGDYDMVISDTSNDATAGCRFALEEKRPSVLLAHSHGICEDSHTFQIRRYPGGPQSILFNLYLHMNSMIPPAETGVLIDGFRVIFAERYHAGGVNGFLMSSSYEIFQDRVVAPARPAPIIALLLSLAIPDISIERPSLSKELVLAAIQEREPVTPPPPATLVPFPTSATDSTGSPTPDNTGKIPEAVDFVVDGNLPPNNTPDHPTPVHAMSRSLASTTATSTSSIATRSSADGITSADILFASKLLHRGPEARTWLVHHGDGGRAYIAKVFDDQDGSGDQAVREQAAIQAVRDRCGNIAPRALGLYRWPEAEGGLLLQEHRGLKLEEPFRDLPQADRDVIWAIATSLHSKGIYHGDLGPDNFVRGQDRVIRVLDFGQADLEHRCPGTDQCHELLCLKDDLATV